MNNTTKSRLLMKFNPGLKKYEPVLPVKQLKNKTKITCDCGWIILIIIAIILLIIVILNNG